MNKEELIEKIIKLIDLAIDKKVIVKKGMCASYLVMDKQGKCILEFRNTTYRYGNTEEHYLKVCEHSHPAVLGEPILMEQLTDEESIKMDYHFLRLNEFLKKEMIFKLNLITEFV